MVVSGSRSPWLKVYLSIVTVFLVIFSSYVSFGEPKKDLSSIKNAAVDAAVDKVCASDDVYNFKTKYSQKDRPAGKKIVGLIFSGRKHYVQILECYVRRNLVSNGGWLDEAIWIINTREQIDINFLEETIKEVPEYSQHIVAGYEYAYQILERNTTYIKIDDDVVFMEDHTIPAIVKKLNDNPQYSLVSANVMNQPALSWVHYHLGVVRPYLPEMSPPYDFVENRTSVDSWRLSNTPNWKGNFTNFTETFTLESIPPFKGHRWLRLPDTTLVEHTPIGILANDGLEYNAFSKGWASWALAAQQHYSFLENLERKQLWRYKFDTWYYHFERLSINFVAFDGETLLDHPMPDSDDEHWLTIDMPKNISRPAVLDGTGMAVHFGFNTQGTGLNDTDLLLRYQNFADEYICGQLMGSPRY